MGSVIQVNNNIERTIALPFVYALLESKEAVAYRRCYEKTSYVSNFALSFYCMNGSIEGRCTNYKKSFVCNSDFIARSVILEFFKVMYLPSIEPFMH